MDALLFEGQAGGWLVVDRRQCQGGAGGGVDGGRMGAPSLERGTVLTRAVCVPGPPLRGLWEC
jgi:hypothetical protein